MANSTPLRPAHDDPSHTSPPRTATQRLRWRSRPPSARAAAFRAAAPPGRPACTRQLQVARTSRRAGVGASPPSQPADRDPSDRHPYHAGRTDPASMATISSRPRAIHRMWNSAAQASRPPRRKRPPMFRSRARHDPTSRWSRIARGVRRSPSPTGTTSIAAARRARDHVRLLAGCGAADAAEQRGCLALGRAHEGDLTTAMTA